MKKRDLTRFGVAVKKALIDRRMTQSELARTVGTTKQYLDLILHGERAGLKYKDSIIEFLELDSLNYISENGDEYNRHRLVEHGLF